MENEIAIVIALLIGILLLLLYVCYRALRAGAKLPEQGDSDRKL